MMSPALLRHEQPHQEISRHAQAELIQTLIHSVFDPGGCVQEVLSRMDVGMYGEQGGYSTSRMIDITMR